MKKILIVLFCIGNFILVRAQHWEGLDGGTEPMGVVFSIFEHDNSLIVGGSFSTIGGGTIPSIITGIWNGSSWLNTPWNIQQGSPKDNIIYNNELHIGGNFTRINGNKYCNKVARLDSTGWMPLGSGVTNGEVRAMASYNGDLYVGGTFTVVDSTISANRVARWDGSSWHTIGSGIPGGFGVYAMEVFQNELYVGGYFSTINGISTPGIARFDGANWHSLATGTNGPVLALFPDTVNNRLYIGGQFTIAGGVSTPTGIAYWDGVSWYPAGLEPYVPSVAIYVYNGKLYNATTQYGLVNSLGDTIKNICWLEGNIWRDVGGGLNAEANAFMEFQNELYVGGHFTHAGDSLVNGIAKWVPGSLGVGAVTDERLPVKVIPNPAKDEVILEMNFNKPMELELLVTDSNGKTLHRESISGNGQYMHKVNTTEFLSGLYMFSFYEGNKLLASKKVMIQK